MPRLPTLPFLSVPSKSPSSFSLPRLSKRGTILDNKANDPAGPVNIFKPYHDVPEQVVYNMKNPWRVSYANSTSTSWAYYEVSDPVVETRTEPYKTYADQVLEKPNWYIHFHIAVRSDQPEDYEKRAMKIVQSAEKWCSGNLSLLAHLFVARAAICDDEELLWTVALFAQRVCYYFQDFQDSMPSYYATFLAQLERTLTGTFLACWDQDCPRSLARLPYVEHQTEDYLASSLNLAKFMGALVKYGVLTTAEIKPCVRLLVHQPTHTEHLKAIRDILAYGQDDFWRKASNDNVSGFLEALNEAASLAEEVSVHSQEELQGDDDDDDTCTVTSPSESSPEPASAVTGAAIYEEILELVDRYSQVVSF